MEPRVAEPR